MADGQIGQVLATRPHQLAKRLDGVEQAGRRSGVQGDTAPLDGQSVRLFFDKLRMHSGHGLRRADSDRFHVKGGCLLRPADQQDDIRRTWRRVGFDNTHRQTGHLANLVLQLTGGEKGFVAGLGRNEDEGIGVESERSLDQHQFLWLGKQMYRLSHVKLLSAMV